MSQLSESSDEFRTRWAVHDVRHHVSGRKHHHPVIDEIELLFEAMPLGRDTATTDRN